MSTTCFPAARSQSALVAGALFFAFATPACRDVHVPMTKTPSEVGTVTGTIRVDTKGTEERPDDIRECILRRTSSKEGRAYGVDLIAPKSKYKLVIDPPNDTATLTLPSDAAADPKVVALSKSTCSDHVVHFYERDHIVHGNVRLDCQAGDLHVVVAASVDNCE